MTRKELLEAFIRGSDDSDPILKEVRAVVRSEIQRIVTGTRSTGRPRLGDDNPKRAKWREYSKAYRERKRAEVKG